MEVPLQVQTAFLLNAEAAAAMVPGRGKIRTGYLRGFKDLVRDLGGNASNLLERCDLDPKTFEDPDHDIECAAAVNLVEHCSRSLRDPLFGLHLAEQQEPDVFGCAMALARAAPDLRQAVESLILYVPLSVSPECEIEMVTGRKVVELRWRTQTGLGDREQLNYQGLLLFMKTLRMLGRQHFRPWYASLAFPIRRTDIEPLEGRLGCKVRGRAEANAIAFPIESLGYPIATSDRMLFGLLGNCLPQLRAASKSDFVEQVEAQVRSALVLTQPCSLAGCAEKLGTSGRTLQKRLTRMGVKFSDILQKERIELARHSLLWSDQTLDEIAFRLGYAEQTSFGRAFKRVAKMTPQAFRLANRER